MKRPAKRLPANGPHVICQRCDLCVGLDGAVCPMHGAMYLTQCFGPGADRKSPWPPCTACVLGLDRALRLTRAIQRTLVAWVEENAK